jgi:hypothetical protein
MLKGSPARPVLIFFVVLNALFIVFRNALTAKGFSVDLLIIGNLLLFGITLASFFLLFRGLKAASTPAFLRSVYSGFMFKFFIVAAVVFGYVFSVDGKINKPSIFALMALYLVYTFIETRTLLRLSKKNKHG